MKKLLKNLVYSYIIIIAKTKSKLLVALLMLMQVSMVTVEKFHSEADEIQ